MDLSFRSRKRSRDDDDGDFGVRIEGVPADKKQRNTAGLQLPPWLRDDAELRPSINRAHSLPFRLDNTAPPPALFESFETSPTDSSANSPASYALPEPTDMDMDMDQHISIAGSASPPSPFTQAHPHLSYQRPEKLNSPGLDFSGRIPTPIHSSFNLMQTQQQPSRLSQATRSRTDSFLPSAAAQMNPHPRFAGPMKHMTESDCAMPSPIAENPLIEDDDDFDLRMAGFPSSQLSRLSVSQDGMMDVDDGRVMWSQGLQRSSSNGSMSFDVTPPTPTTPGRIGRARSGAFSASDGNGTEGKGSRRVVFGFREDCIEEDASQWVCMGNGVG